VTFSVTSYIICDFFSVTFLQANDKTQKHMTMLTPETHKEKQNTLIVDCTEGGDGNGRFVNYNYFIIATEVKDSIWITFSGSWSEVFRKDCSGVKLCRSLLF